MSVVPPGVLPGGTGGRIEDGCKGTCRFGLHSREDVFDLDCFADRQRGVLAAVSARFSMTVDNEDHEQGDDDGEEDDGEAGRSLRVAMRRSRCCLGPARAADSGWLGQAETDT